MPTLEGDAAVHRKEVTREYDGDLDRGNCRQIVRLRCGAGRICRHFSTRRTGDVLAQ